MTTRVELHQGDCLDVMPTLAAGSVAMVFADNQFANMMLMPVMTKQTKHTIKKMYAVKKLNTVEIGRVYGVTPGTIGRWLRLWGIKIRSASVAAAMRPAFTEAHKRKMSVARKTLFAKGYQVANKGVKASDILIKKNIVGRMRSNINLDAYIDVAKLKMLTYYLSKHRAHFGTDDAKKTKFLEKFYFDKQFNAIYDAWILSGKSKWVRPSIDHKTPVSRGGSLRLQNLQFLTWFENRAKAEMTETEWAKFCRATATKSALFIRR